MSSIRSSRRAPALPIVLIVLLVASIGFGAYYYKQYQDLKITSSKTPEQRNEELIAKINKVYQLPKDETPVVALVTDEAKFKEEYPVFTEAKKDDSLLLYEKAGQAVLYRDSENRVVGTATFAVKRGKTLYIVGDLAGQNAAEASLAALSGEVRVAGKVTPVGQYTATTVVDVTGQNSDLAQKVASLVGGTVAERLPVDEKVADDAEIVVLVASAPAITQ
jgi:hypothetical protein